ncbi:MAG: glycerate kinase [Chloroflexota bacterium]|nr:glycerate kinase [Chloroflexota bacterium]MDE2884089.1 glycerate kinase [Chloroflexota bacterium]
MKVVVAPQSFKGSISALDAARAMREGVLRTIPDAQTVLVPVADGGDGTLETLVEATGGDIRPTTVTGPTGRPVSAEWGALGDGQTAVIEMARTSGLALLSVAERDPLHATTYGLGEAVREALDAGFRSFIMGIGGSATNDGGAGMAQALGIRLLDEHGKDLPAGGAALADLRTIDMSGLDERALGARFSVACDVSNPLTGPEGASAVYGPQKGATPELVEQLDAALRNFAKVVERDTGTSVEAVPGSGAAGGLGGGMMAFLGGSLRAGVDIVLDHVGLDQKLTGADLVITGEGQIDFQTVYNKAPIGVARRAKQRGIPVLAVCGSLGKGFEAVHAEGIDAVVSILTAPMTLDEASARAGELIADATAEAMRSMRVGSAVFGQDG